MKHATLKEIIELTNIVHGRTERVKGLKKLITDGASGKDLDWIGKELEEHQKFLEKAQAEIAKFYAPATT